MSQITTINFNYAKEMRTYINKIKNIGFKHAGIIFGGLVRDEIISTHYRQMFIDKKIDFNQYWNPEYDPETKHRLLLPNDVDIYFNSKEKANKFVREIVELLKNYHGNVNVVNIDNSINFKYMNENYNLKQYKINTYIEIGKTFTFRGIKIKLDMDVIYFDDTNGTSLFVEPPFYNLDFLCNIFVMEEINGYNVIRHSNSTGTPLDRMSLIQKTKKLLSIMDDIIHFKTQFVRNLDTLNAEFVNSYRIIKMMNKKEKWEITNLPFSVVSNISLTPKENKTCCICLEEILEDDDINIIVMNKNSNKYHYDCFMEYLEKEKNKKYRNPKTNELECRCPFRTPFNFKDCYKLITYNS